LTHWKVDREAKTQKMYLEMDTSKLIREFNDKEEVKVVDIELLSEINSSGDITETKVKLSVGLP